MTTRTRRELTGAQKILGGILFAVVLTLVLAIVVGLLAWAVVAVWAQVLS